VNKNVETICKQAGIIFRHFYGETEENYKVLELAQPMFQWRFDPGAYRLQV